MSPMRDIDGVRLTPGTTPPEAFVEPLRRLLADPEGSGVQILTDIPGDLAQLRWKTSTNQLVVTYNGVEHVI